MKKIFKFLNNLIKRIIGTVLTVLMFLMLTILIMRIVGLWSINYVDGISMEPTFTSGDRVISTSLFSNYKRGDVVIAKANNEEIIKRVIALPNETISYDTYNIYINGNALPSKYMYEGINQVSNTYTLAQDEYFLVGDNRTPSYDSRFYGPVNKNNIEGVVLFKFNIDKYEVKVLNIVEKLKEIIKL